MLYQKITGDLKKSLKSGDGFRLGILRMLSAALHNKEIEKKSKGQDSILSEDEIIEVLLKEAKKRKEAAEIYQKGNRNDLSEKETKELEIIKKYLPEQLSKEEVEKIVIATIEKINAVAVKDFGKVMAEAMKELKNKADASLVSEIVKDKLKI